MHASHSHRARASQHVIVGSKVGLMTDKKVSPLVLHMGVCAGIGASNHIGHLDPVDPRPAWLGDGDFKMIQAIKVVEACISQPFSSRHCSQYPHCCGHSLQRPLCFHRRRNTSLWRTATSYAQILLRICIAQALQITPCIGGSIDLHTLPISVC